MDCLVNVASSLESVTPIAAPGVNALTCELITDANSMSNLREEWNRVDSEDRCPMRSWEWLGNWWRFFSSRGDELFTFIIRTPQRELVAILPMFLERSVRRGKCLRFLGSGDVCTDYNTLISRPAFRTESAEIIAKTIATEFSNRFDRIELESVLPDDAGISVLTSELNRLGFSSTHRDALSSWQAKLNPLWDDYLATLSRTRRSRTRRIQREYFDTGRTKVHRATDNSTFQRGFEILVDLHQRRRTSLGEAGCFASPRFREFLFAAGLDLLQTNQLHLQWLEMDNEPIAAEFDLRSVDTIYYYQSGMAPEAENDRPGWQGIIASLSTACESGITCFDFLRGDEAYKSSWGAKEVPQQDICMIPPRMSAKVREVVRSAGYETCKPIANLLRKHNLRS